MGPPVTFEILSRRPYGRARGKHGGDDHPLVDRHPANGVRRRIARHLPAAVVGANLGTCESYTWAFGRSKRMRTPR